MSCISEKLKTANTIMCIKKIVCIPLFLNLEIIFVENLELFEKIVLLKNHTKSPVFGKLLLNISKTQIANSIPASVGRSITSTYETMAHIFHETYIQTSCKIVDKAHRRVITHDNVPREEYDFTYPKIFPIKSFTPCHKEKSYVTTLYLIALLMLFGKFCLQSDSISPQQSIHRIEFRMVILEDKRFFLNLSVVEFSFTAQHYCFGEFLYIYPPTKESSKQKLPEYVFCRQKHPWQIIYPLNIIIVKVVARKTSSFSMLYQVMNKAIVTNFQICQPDTCDSSQKCADFRPYLLQRKISGYDKLFLTHTLQFHRVANVFIFYVEVKKFKHLVLHDSGSILESIHDSPTVESRKIILSGKEIAFSSFQATIVLCDDQLQNRYKNTRNFRLSSAVTFSSVINKKSLKTIEKAEYIYFGENSTTKPAFQTFWLLQPKHLSYNIQISFVSYQGPVEIRNMINYGGISVYFLDESGNDEEVVTINHSFS